MTQSMIRPMSGDYTEYLRDESRVTGSAESIAFPKCEAEVQALLREVYPSGQRITVQGARTGLAAAAVPSGGLILNLSRMNRVLGIRENAAGSFFVTVEPGVILSRLKKQIETKKFETGDWSEASLQAYKAFCAAPEQFLTPDPTESSATIGGMAACNASGARSYLYGPTRRWVTALRVILPDGDALTLKRGTVFASGRRMTLTTESGRELTFALPTYKLPETKNASGYFVADDMDAIDLFIGSDGTLGVATSVELLLLPMPKVVWGVTCFLKDDDQAVAFVQSLRQGVDQLSSIEFFNGDALELLRYQKANNTAFAQLPALEPRYGCAVFTELHCDSEEAALKKLFRIGALLEQCGGREADTWVARNAADRDRLYFFRHAIPESVNMRIDQLKKEDPAITKLGSDMSVPDSCLGEIMKLYTSSLRENQLQSAIFGHIGNNHLHVNILPRSEEEYRRGKALFAQWAAAVTKMGGAISAEHGVGKLKAGFLSIMYGPLHIREMAQLKAVFDPKGTLGTGNLFTPVIKEDEKI